MSTPTVNPQDLLLGSHQAMEVTLTVNPQDLILGPDQAVGATPTVNPQGLLLGQGQAVESTAAFAPQDVVLGPSQAVKATPTVKPQNLCFGRGQAVESIPAVKRQNLLLRPGQAVNCIPSINPRDFVLGRGRRRAVESTPTVNPRDGRFGRGQDVEPRQTVDPRDVILGPGRGQALGYNNTLVSTADLGHSHFGTSWPGRPKGIPVPTPERPLLGPARKMMLECLFLFESTYSLWYWLGHIARLVQKDAIIPFTNTVQAIDLAISPQSHEKDYFMVFYALPSGLRNSLIQGTLAYDYMHNRAISGPELLQRGRYAGIYAVGIAIEGRNGGFINKKECTTVAKLLATYAHAYELLTTSKDEHTIHPDQREFVIKYARLLDQCCGHPPPLPTSTNLLHYMPTPNLAVNNAHLKSLSQSFFQRAATLTQLACDDTTVIHQTPLFIGATTQPMNSVFPKRHVHCDPRTTGVIPPGNNKFLSLTLGALRFLKLRPYTVEVPILPVATPEQMVLGEQFVTLLASAMVHLGGFNDGEPGQQPGAPGSGQPGAPGSGGQGGGGGGEMEMLDVKLWNGAFEYLLRGTRYCERNAEAWARDARVFGKVVGRIQGQGQGQGQGGLGGM